AAAEAAASPNSEIDMADIPTPAQVALARRRYLEQATLQSIRRESGLSSRQVYRCLDGHNDDGSGTPLKPLARRRAAAPAARGSKPGDAGNRRELVARLWRSAECQVEDIEQRLRAAGLEVAEREGNARAFAILVKTVRELAAFDAAQKPTAQKEIE